MAVSYTQLDVYERQDDGMCAGGFGSREHGCEIFDDAGIHSVVDVCLLYTSV